MSFERTQEQRAREAAELANKQAREAQERDIIEKQQQVRAKAPTAVAPKPPRSTPSKPSFVDETLPKRTAVVSPVLKDTFKDLRTKVVAPVLDSLQTISDVFEKGAGFPTPQQTEGFRRSPGGLEGTLGLQTPFEPKNVNEFINRVAFAVTSGVKGGVKEITLPLSWGLSPPKTGFGQAFEVGGAIFTPAPIDYAATKIFSSMALTKRGQNLLKILRGGSKSDISDNAETIIRYIDEFGDSKKLKVSSTEDLLKIGNRADDLIAQDPTSTTFEEIINTDNTLTGVGGKDWKNGLGVKDILNYQRESLKGIKDGINKLDDVLGLMIDIDPDAPAIALQTLSPEQQRRVIKRALEISKFWDDEVSGLYTAGAAWEPDLIVLSKRIEGGLSPEQIAEIITEAPLRSLSPAALGFLLESLNKKAPVDDTVEKFRLSLSESELNKMRENLEDASDAITDLDEEVVQDLEDILDVLEKPIPGEGERDRPTPPEEIQKQDQIQDEALIQETVLTEVPVTTPVRLRKKDKEKRNKINLPLFRGRKQKYRVTFFFTAKEKEIKVVEARSYPSAVNKAQRGRRPRKKQPKLIDIVPLGKVKRK